MTYINLHAKSPPHGFHAPASRSKAMETHGVMPTHIFLRLFMSAFAAIILVHFWKNGGR